MAASNRDAQPGNAYCATDRAGAGCAATSQRDDGRDHPWHAAGSRLRPNTLPTEDQVPDGLIQTADRQRTLDVVAVNYADPTDTAQRFTEWGWQGNVVRGFDLPDGASVPPGSTTSIDVSVHLFASAEGAAAALDYSFVDQATTSGAHEEPGRPIGDASRVLVAQDEEGTGVTLYVQRGNSLIRVTAFSPDGDPTEDAFSVAETILAK